MEPLGKKHIAAGVGIALNIAMWFIAPSEGVVYQSHWDAISKRWDICRGHTDGVHEGMTATEQDCDNFYKADVAKAQGYFRQFVAAPQFPNVEAACISFIYNDGPGNFARSTLRRYLNENNRTAACNEFPRWHDAGGKDCRNPRNNCGGIVTRRQREKELCLSNELRHCDYYSGVCQPVSLRTSQSGR